MPTRFDPDLGLESKLLWLCSIASPTGDEGLICGELTHLLQRMGVARDRILRHGNSLCVELTSGRSGPTIALVGHTDVVRTQHDTPPHVDGDRLYGPGASDMKSGLALMLGLVSNPVATQANLTLVLYASEEGPYVDNELGLLVREVPALRSIDFALVLEPTDNQLQLGCGGTLHAEVKFVGKSAHSARPWQGKNAIHQSVGVLTRLAALQPVTHCIDGLEWVTSMSATLARGGRAPNVVPDEFILNINARYAPDQSTDEVEAELKQLVARDGEVTIVDNSPPASPFRHHPLVQLLEACGAKAVAPKFGWTDVARFAALGIPAVNFGPGTLSQAHQRNEWTSVGDLHYGDGVLRRWLGAIGS